MAEMTGLTLGQLFEIIGQKEAELFTLRTRVRELESLLAQVTEPAPTEPPA